MKLTAVVTENWETEPRESDLFLQLLCLLNLFSVFLFPGSLFPLWLMTAVLDRSPRSQKSEGPHDVTSCCFVFFYIWLDPQRRTHLTNEHVTTYCFLSVTTFWRDFNFFNFLPSSLILSLSKVLQRRLLVLSLVLPPAGWTCLWLCNSVLFTIFFWEKNLKWKKKTVKITGLNITKRLVLTVALRWTEM